MKSNLLVTPWADFTSACQAFWILARSAHLMLPPVIFGNWTALAVTFYFFRRLLRTSKLLQIAKLCTGGFIPQLLCSQFKHRTLQAESKADLLKHLLSEGQNTLGTPWSLSELDKLCFFLHWDPDLGGYWKSLTEVKRSCCSFHNFFFLCCLLGLNLRYFLSVHILIFVTHPPYMPYQTSPTLIFLEFL